MRILAGWGGGVGLANRKERTVGVGVGGIMVAGLAV